MDGNHVRVPGQLAYSKAQDLDRAMDRTCQHANRHRREAMVQILMDEAAQAQVPKQEIG
jgi:hypothetical protein